MKRGIVQRCLWVWVAACAAWRAYPTPTTVVANDDLARDLRAYLFATPPPKLDEDERAALFWALTTMEHCNAAEALR